MPKNAQSALEYMMTYGWAILIIVIVAAVLYSLGIFNPSSSAGNTASGFGGFTVQQGGFTCNSTGVFLALGNSQGTQVTVLNASITSSTGLSTPTGSNGSINKLVNPQSTITIKFTSNTCSITGARYSANIQIYYSTTGALGTQTQPTTGTISGSSS